MPGGREDKCGHPGQLTPSQSWSRDRHFGGSVRASWELGNQPAQLLGLLLQHVENLTKSRNRTSPSENHQNGKRQERQTRSNTWAGAGRWLVPWTPRPIAALPESSRVNADGLPYSPQLEVGAQGHTPSAERAGRKSLSSGSVPLSFPLLACQSHSVTEDRRPAFRV